MRSWYVTQSNGAVLRKSSIRKLPTNMATEKAVTYAKKKKIIAWCYSLWMVKVLENVFRGIICSFAVNNRSNLWQYWTQMFTLFPAAIFVLLHGVPRVSPINFCYTFWRTTQQKKTAQTCDLARLLIYRYSIISEILGFRHPTVLILVFDGVTVKTTNIFPL